VIDPLTEELILPREATRLFPRCPKGKTLHISAVYRYMSAGVRGVVLESLDAPRKCTSRQAVARFLARLSSVGKPTPLLPRGDIAGRHADPDVEHELDRLGF
jgi:hypothetical protein